MRREDPTFVPPTAVHNRPLAEQQHGVPNGEGTKRAREAGDADTARGNKREKVADDDDDDDDDDAEEMEIDDDDESGARARAQNSMSCILLRPIYPIVVHNAAFLFLPPWPVVCVPV